VAVITDSAADLPDALAERYDIHLVPVRVSVDGRDYLDKVGLATADFYRRMAVAHDVPRTSQPPPGDFRRPFEFLLAHHEAVLYVGLSRAVSGTLQSAEHAAARAGEGRVHVLDSVNAAGGQALLAWRAAELAAEGHAVADVVAEVERLRPLTLTWAMARDIRHAVRGGRIPAWAEPVVRWTGLTPVARFRDNGQLKVAGGLFARRSAPEAFARYVARRLPAGTRWRAIVGHCDAAEDGARLLDALRAHVDVVEAHLVETGPAIGAHAGRGALVVAVQPAP
jgi:DegV family protein with EDD domain